MSSDSADPFYWMRVILASNRGIQSLFCTGPISNLVILFSVLRVFERRSCFTVTNRSLLFIFIDFFFILLYSFILAKEEIKDLIFEIKVNAVRENLVSNELTRINLFHTKYLCFTHFLANARTSCRIKTLQFLNAIYSGKVLFK